MRSDGHDSSSCDRRLLLVGNGASELIRALLPELDGTLGVVRPTFEEYPRLIPAARLAEITPSGPDFGYTVGELLAFARERELSSLVLVNPDNPTGHWLPLEDVLCVGGEAGRARRAARCRRVIRRLRRWHLDHTLLCDDILGSIRT